MITPVIVFAYNRPDKLRRVLTALKAQSKKPDAVIGILDGPRHPGDELLVKACKRDMAGVVDEIIERPNNFGCAGNIMAGTREIAERFERFVVLEDDTLPAITWYEAMCALLDQYTNDEKVWAVGAYPSVLNGSLDAYPYDVILSPRFSCWGWGSWRKHWLKVCVEWAYYRDRGGPPWDPRALPGHAGPDIANMILHYRAGQLWDGVVAGSFLHHGVLQAIPRYYLVHNIGAEIHVTAEKIRFMMTNNPVQERVPQSFPPDSILDERVGQAVRAYVRAMA